MNESLDYLRCISFEEMSRWERTLIQWRAEMVDFDCSVYSWHIESSLTVEFDTSYEAD